MGNVWQEAEAVEEDSGVSFKFPDPGRVTSGAPRLQVAFFFVYDLSRGRSK